MITPHIPRFAVERPRLIDFMRSNWRAEPWPDMMGGTSTLHAVVSGLPISTLVIGHGDAATNRVMRDLQALRVPGLHFDVANGCSAIAASETTIPWDAILDPWRVWKAVARLPESLRDEAEFVVLTVRDYPLIVVRVRPS